MKKRLSIILVVFLFSIGLFGARTEITVDTMSTAGIVIATDAGIADGHKFSNALGDVFLYVTNSDVGAHNITIQTPGTVEGEPIAERVVSIGASAIVLIGPFTRAVYNQSDGMVYVDYAAGEHDHFAVVPIKSADVK